jgi:spermidine dehydrogenase
MAKNNDALNGLPDISRRDFINGTVVMSVGGWVARRIVSDIPRSIQNAYSQFYHAPILVVNLALRNWQFLDKLGISSGNWFEGFGDFFSIRRPMKTGDSTQPFEPDKLVVMTFYVSFAKPGYPVEEQGPLGAYDLVILNSAAT